MARRGEGLSRALQGRAEGRGCARNTTPAGRRGHNTINRIVDISSYIDVKVRANVAYKDKGAAGDAGLRLRRNLAKQGKRLPLLGDDDDTANFNYVKHFMMGDNKILGTQYGLEYAEAFHYIGPSTSRPNPRESRKKYIDTHVVPL
jgi:hypothetical protein